MIDDLVLAGVMCSIIFSFEIDLKTEDCISNRYKEIEILAYVRYHKPHN